MHSESSVVLFAFVAGAGLGHAIVKGVVVVTRYVRQRVRRRRSRERARQADFDAWLLGRPWTQPPPWRESFGVEEPPAPRARVH